MIGAVFPPTMKQPWDPGCYAIRNDFRSGFRVYCLVFVVGDAVAGENQQVTWCSVFR